MTGRVMVLSGLRGARRTLASWRGRRLRGWPFGAAGVLLAIVAGDALAEGRGPLAPEGVEVVA